MINLDKLKRARHGRQAALIDEVVSDPLAGLSPDAAEQRLRDERNHGRRARRAAAREELKAQARRQAFARLEQVGEAVEAYYGSQAHAAAPVLRGGSLVVQVSDVHFGCVVRGLEQRDNANTWDSQVACRRFKTLAEAAKFHGISHGAEELVVALTGDLFDSKIGKERYDKLLNSETAAALTYMRGKDLLIQFIDDLRASEIFGAIRVVGIAGNEARLYADRGHSHIMASDNWDALLNADLAARYRGSDVACEFGVNRYVAEIQGWRMLLIHGDQGRFNPTNQTQIQSLLGNHDADFGISGHIHDTLITGKWIRCASMMGTDAYAGDGLGLEGMAAQTILWLAPGVRHAYAIDLQNPSEELVPYQLFDYAGAFGFADNLFGFEHQ